MRLYSKWILKKFQSGFVVFLSACFALMIFGGIEAQAVDMKSSVASTPPMGWNSFDAYDCRINEQEFRAHVNFMADNLLAFGWEYAVIDYIWWHPEPGNWDSPRRKGHPNIRYKENGEPLHPEYITMDEYGRLLPSVNRFPSAANGKGFKPLADYVHSKGMKFGIHIMRGIHRYAAFLDTPIKGTSYSAKDIAEPWDTCGWCNHMWGVDATKPGAQAYYNSLFELYAKWGVDFIKADDTMFPPYHKGDIEMMRKAIDLCKRPMVLSLSCGEAPLGQASHLKTHANMWRISGDFWDNWESLEHNFDLLNAWSSHIGPGTWPDADMLPLGRLSLDDRPHGPERQTEFTVPEQVTLMTLWCMVRSPLMLGADLLSMDDQTMQLLTNPEVIAVNQHSVDNRQVLKTNGACVWIATDPGTDNKYVALFNMKDTESNVTFDLELEHLRGSYSVRDVWTRKEVGKADKALSRRLPPHGAGLYKLSKTKKAAKAIEFQRVFTLSVKTPGSSWKKDNAASMLTNPKWQWQTLKTNGLPTGRHETSLVELGEKFYMIGGRESRQIDQFDPDTLTWTKMGVTTPLIHHYQPVVWNQKIYMVGAMTGGYPKEPPMARVQIYNPTTDSWSEGDEIPVARRRGGAGTVVYNKKIYMACGITLGHTSGTCNWFDEYDPATGTWTQLPEAPHIRDHFHAVVVNDKMYCIGGRNTSYRNPVNPKQGDFFGAVERAVDVYDFKTGRWSTLAQPLPYGSAAGGTAVLGDTIIYFGGETAKDAINRTQALDTRTGNWSQLAPLKQGRHGSQAVVYQNCIYIAAGSPNRGGGHVNSIEMFSNTEK